MDQNEDNNIFCQCLYYAAGAFGRKMNKLAEDAFAQTGLAPSYAFVLMAVNRKPGITPSELSGQMMLTPSTITRLVEKLEAKEYLERHPEGRVTTIHPTRKSKLLDKKLRASWKSLYEAYSEILGEESAQKLTADIYEASLKIDD